MVLVPLTPQVFAILSALIEERTGIHYPLSELELLRDKAAPRVLDAGFESFLDYYYFLRYDAGGAEEFARLVEALVVGETYFFREYDQLRVLTGKLVPERLARQERVRIWSAACATGEEPLTVAMLLEQRGLRDRVDLVASDISQKALDRARAGHFGRRSVRSISDPGLVERFLERDGEGYRVEPSLISGIDFRQVNLTDEAQVAKQGTFDFILCRNVLIYFRDDTAARVVESLQRSLSPGGALLVSVSESLMRFGTSLSCEEHEGVFVYKKGA